VRLWGLIGVMLAAHFLICAQYSHLHRSGDEHHAARPHWHLPLGGPESLRAADDPNDAVDLAPSAEPLSAAVGLLPFASIMLPPTEPRPAQVRESAEPCSHDPPQSAPFAPRPPPA
jgi:hypothetical protein